MNERQKIIPKSSSSVELQKDITIHCFNVEEMCKLYSKHRGFDTLCHKTLETFKYEGIKVPSHGAE